MIKLGITGGIGSGKSYVTNILARRGVPVYDTDSEAKRLMETSDVIRTRLTALVGQNAYRADGSLNKAMLASYLFSSPLHARNIAQIVHPVVREDFLSWVSGQRVPLVVMECAILFESGFDAFVDEVLLVHTPESVCLERAMRRDGATEEQVRARMAAQMQDAERCRRASYILENDGTNDVEPVLDTLLSEMRSKEECKD